MINPNHLRILAQIIDSMDDIIKKIETAKNKNNREELLKGEREILNLQRQADQILRGEK